MQLFDFQVSSCLDLGKCWVVLHSVLHSRFPSHRRTKYGYVDWVNCEKKDGYLYALAFVSVELSRRQTCPIETTCGEKLAIVNVFVLNIGDGTFIMPQIKELRSKSEPDDLVYYSGLSTEQFLSYCVAQHWNPRRIDLVTSAHFLGSKPAAWGGLDTHGPNHGPIPVQCKLKISW